MAGAGSDLAIHAYVRMGKRAEAEKLAAEHGRYPYRMVIIATAMGDTVRAIEALEQTMVSEPHRVPLLLVEPELAPLRVHPRVVAIRRELNLP